MHVIELIPDNQTTPSTAPEIPLLEAVGARDDVRFAVLGSAGVGGGVGAGGCGFSFGGGGGGGGGRGGRAWWWGGKRDDYCGVETWCTTAGEGVNAVG